MRKEYLEALDRLYKCNDDDYTLGYQQYDYKLLQQALKRLESIDKANPSEALEYIEILAGELGISKDAKFAETRFPKMLITIQRALLKSQEPKQYLKWEDLEFKEEEQKMKVILNGSMHLLCYFRNMFGTSICIIDNTDITIRRENRDFFNDLHLEVVEDE